MISYLFLLAQDDFPLEPEFHSRGGILDAFPGAIAAEDVASAGGAALTGAHVAAVGAFQLAILKQN